MFKIAIDFLKFFPIKFNFILHQYCINRLNLPLMLFFCKILLKFVFFMR
nr:MAG TPA: hypothetical protein [Caudoviricetes sp.]